MKESEKQSETSFESLIEGATWLYFHTTHPYIKVKMPFERNNAIFSGVSEIENVS